MVIHVSCGQDPTALAELIAATLHGLIPPDPRSSTADLGRAVRAAQEASELARLRRGELPTVNFARLEPDDDWTAV